MMLITICNHVIRRRDAGSRRRQTDVMTSYMPYLVRLPALEIGTANFLAAERGEDDDDCVFEMPLRCKQALPDSRISPLRYVTRAIDEVVSLCFYCLNV